MTAAAPANPLLQDWTASGGLPPFDALHAEHFAPAFDLALREHRAELDAIAALTEPPSFENTVAAFDASGRRLRRLEHAFHNLAASQSTPALQAVERELAPRLAAHDSAVHAHAGLFARLEALHERREAQGLDPESLRLLERVHLDFVRAGARLAPPARARHAALAERLAALYTTFSQNLLADEAEWLLPLEGEADLAGLPEGLRQATRQAARQRGLGEGAHAVVLSMSIAMPFLAFSARRHLRERVWRAWTARGTLHPRRDNRAVAREIVALRLELARLHGCASYADYALADRMAGTPAAARGLLERVWAPALARAAEERRALEALAAAQGAPGPLAPWDWRYWAEQLRRERYAIDDDELKPYFSLEAMIGAMFDCAGRLFGLRFTERTGCLPLYHPDVRLWEVSRAATGEPVGLFLGDNCARPGKRGGAWMSVYRAQSRLGTVGRHDGDVRPIVVNNNNFAKAPDGEPTLLSFDDLRTLFHEFGHGLHGLLSDVRYERLAGTRVLRDFVELPSQLFEHWALEPEVLKRHARHVRTGEPIPDALLERAKAARRFNQGFETVQLTAPGLIDLALHGLADVGGLDLEAFERAERERLGVPEAIGVRHALPHFRHLFASDSYAAGYYVYQWAEVLDADAFGAFTEAGDPFDAATAARLLRHVYAAGDSVEPRAAYRAFRGRDAAVEPMLEKRGLLGAPA